MEDILNHMIAEVSKQHQALERECGALKDLLKPWPRKKTATDNSKESLSAPPVHEVQKAAETLSQDERQALSQVEELLRKAEKTRLLKSKMSGVKRDIQQVRCDDQEKNLLSIPEKNETDNSQVLRINPESNKGLDVEKNNKKVVASDGSLQKTEGLQKQITGSQQSQPRNSFMEGKNVSINKNTSASSRETNKISEQRNSKTRSSHRPSSGRVQISEQRSSQPHSSHRPSSGRAHHTPVHMTAPFKTSENTGFSNRRKNHTRDQKGSAKVSAKTSVLVGVKASKTLPEVTSGVINRSGQISDKCADSETRTCSLKMDSAEQSFPISNSSMTDVDCIRDALRISLPESIPPADVSSDNCSSSDVQKSTSCTSIEQFVSEDGFVQAQDEMNSDLFDPQKQFTLQKNGSSDLKVPSRLKKLASINKSLRDRCSTVETVKKTFPIDPAQKFVERLCAEGKVGQELTKCVSALTCLRSHKVLLEALESLHLDQLSDNTPVDDLYRARRTLEFVLTTFAELQDTADYFSQVRYRQPIPVRKKHSTEKIQQESFWPATKDTGSHDDLKEHLQASKRWTHLQFTEKLLQMHISLIKSVRTEWQELLLSEKRDHHVLQGVYGLLTSSGQFLPVLIENKN